jgi:hypothetical protein
VAEKAEAMVDLGISNSRMKDFTDVAMAARRVAFDGDTLVAALRATFRRRGTPLPELEVVALSDRFVQDANAQANWKAFATRNRPRDFESPSLRSCPSFGAFLFRHLSTPELVSHSPKAGIRTDHGRSGSKWTHQVVVAPVIAGPKGATASGSRPQRG